MNTHELVPIFVNSYKAGFDDAVAQIKHGVCNSLSIDFSNVKFFNCENLVRFKCLIHLAKTRNIPLQIKKPRESEVNKNAVTAGLFADAAPMTGQNHGGPIIPLQLIDSEQNDFLFEDLDKAFSSLGPSSNWMPELFEALSELANNIYFHSGVVENSGWGFVQAQKYPDKNEICISICDIGAGLLESYRRRGLVKDRSEQQLVLDSFNELVSSRNSPEVPAHRGKGLYEVLSFVKGFRASLAFSTGSFVVAIKPESDLITITPRAHIEGTLIKLEVPIL